MSKHRVLYLPIETKARELPGKAFLATHAVERGWIVVMGQQSDVLKFMQDGPVGAFIEISIPERKAERLERLSKRGFRIGNLCEESLMYLDGRDYCHSKLGIASLPWVDRLFVIGARNARDIHKYRPQFADKIALTGNPRFDALLPPLRRVYTPKAEAIRGRYGRFLLVNTSFGFHNPLGLPEDAVERLKRMGMITDERHADFMRRQFESEKRKMKGLQAILEQLAAARIVDRIVIRPHPSENQQTWRDWATQFDIDVVFEGSANEWMLAATAMLHPGCTTGVEGMFLDRPVFSYVPEPNSEYAKLSDHLSRQISSAEELTTHLKEVESADQNELRQHLSNERARLADYVANLQPPFATERILDELDRFDLPTFTSHEVMRSTGMPLSFSRKIRGLWRKPIVKRDARSEQKFPGVDLPELMQAADIWTRERTLAKRPNINSLNARIHVWH